MEFGETARKRLVGAFFSSFKSFHYDRAIACLVNAKRETISEFLLQLTDYKNILTLLSKYEDAGKHSFMFLQSQIRLKLNVKAYCLYFIVCADDLIARSSSFRDLLFCSLNEVFSVGSCLSGGSKVIFIERVDHWNKIWGKSCFKLRLGYRFISNIFTKVESTKFEVIKKVEKECNCKIYWLKLRNGAYREGLRYVEHIERIRLILKDSCVKEIREEVMDSDVDWSENDSQKEWTLEVKLKLKSPQEMEDEKKLKRNLFRLCKKELKYLLTEVTVLIGFDNICDCKTLRNADATAEFSFRVKSCLEYFSKEQLVKCVKVKSKSTPTVNKKKTLKKRKVGYDPFRV